MLMSRCAEHLPAIMISLLLQGDSGFMVVRQGQTIFRSEPQEHFFDCPYQFAASPEFSPNTDHVDSAAVVELELQPGDIIVAGTDGLWDNLPEVEVLTLLPSSTEQVHQVGHQVTTASNEEGAFVSDVLLMTSCSVPHLALLQEPLKPARHLPRGQYSIAGRDMNWCSPDIAGALYPRLLPDRPVLIREL